jgi:hypothetical protein
MKTVVVVGDKFSAFAVHGAVLCVSEFESRIREGNWGAEGDVYDIGQGIAALRVDSLVKLAEESGCSDKLRFGPFIMCRKEHVHKRRPENALLSVPKQLADNLFEADVLVDDECELMSDHVAGQHLPAMIQIEAVRQMGLAVTEEYFAKDFPGGCAFLWTSCQVTFAQYVFPVRLRLVCHVREQRKVKIGRMSFIFDMEFIQNGSVVTSSHNTLEVRDRRVVERREKALASAVSCALSGDQLWATR